jgi:hypothetical protein
MTELLALPGWKTASTTLTAWVEALQGLGHVVATTRESTTVSWVEVPALRFRGYVMTQGTHVEAIHFELAAPDPAPARAAIEEATASLGWELTEDDDPPDDD